MHSVGVFHSDLRPEHVELKKVSGQQMGEYFFELRLTAFGFAAVQFQDFRHYTPAYALLDLEARLPFQSKLQRVKADNYAVGRTVMYVMLMSACASENSDVERLFAQHHAEGIEKQFEKLKKYYDAEIVAVVRMLIDEEVPQKIAQRLAKLVQGQPSDVALLSDLALQSDVRLPSEATQPADAEQPSEAAHLSDVEQLVPQIQRAKQSRELRRITAAKFEEESEVCRQLCLNDRILEMADYLGASFDANINFVVIKLRTLIDAGYAEKLKNYIARVEPIYCERSVDQYIDVKER